MRVVALISGGKDSCYNMMQCVSAGHQIVALANLKPPESTGDELDSYMYQTVGHQALGLYAEAMGLPLYRATLQGTSLDTGRAYAPQEGDEVEDLYRLLKLVKEKEAVDSVSVGAILSDYQRVRVENVCQRLGLQPLAFLWRRKQEELLDEMISSGLMAILIKVAAFGLDPGKHLGKTLEEMRPHLKQLSDKYGVHVCGEGGEYETLTLDCPLFKKRIIVDCAEVMMHSNDAFAPVAYLRLSKLHLQDKLTNPALPLQRECTCSAEFPRDPLSCATEECEDTEKRPLIWIPSSLPSVPVCETWASSARSPSGFQWISEINTNGGNVLEASHMGLSSLKDQAQELGLQMSDAVLVHLYVKSMEDFAEINTVYGTHFLSAPPARVCVQCCLPDNASLKMDALFCRPSRADPSSDCVPEKTAMHVQSISHWAPANIGPYSQAVRVGPGLFCAGQIALKPCTMQLVSGGATVEAQVSLLHVERVLDAINPGTTLAHVLLVQCYVTNRSYIPIALAAWAGKNEHEADLAPVTVAIVPMLPRGASVEWHVIAAVSDPEERRHFAICQENLPYQVMLHGVISSCLSCAALSLSLSLAPIRAAHEVRDWHEVSNLIEKALRRATDELPMAPHQLAALCCRVFYRGEEPDSQRLQEGLRTILKDVWAEKPPALVLVPVLDLPRNEILHLTFWLSL
ncbi:hypothetical protein XELAEV_18039995mg [Xenopus laevis]|uniref:Diphthine--ammonia ligase n=1 Tax=Xenopus laevis TaxID=8355 RepID=A0A974C8X2_XENLA|nr:hypothetical protein XELAEV_18039995mg [Xenopus laevis]